MGCFLACFGFTKKRKRRKNSSKITSEDQSYGRYVPLDSDVSVKLGVDKIPKPSATKLSDRPKESSTSKIKKKVSFNLNVKTYEPLPNDDYDAYLSEGEEKTMWEYNQEEKAGTSMLQFEEDSIVSRIGSCPANYRYQNCRNSYDEEDEIELDESDLDDDDNLDSDEEDDDGIDDNDTQKLNSASVKPEEEVATAQLPEERKYNFDQLQASVDQELNKTDTNQSARNRSQHVYSVLNPVENLTQWKAIKAKSRQQQKHQKENIVSEREQHIPTHMNKNSHPSYSNSLPNLNHSNPMKHEIAVDASLSNWLS